MENTPDNLQQVPPSAPTGLPPKRKKKKKIKKTVWYKMLGLFVLSALIIAIFFFYQGKKQGSLVNLYQEAENHELKGQYVLALNDYIDIAKKFPFNSEAHIRIGKLYLKVDEIENAKLEFFTAIKMNKDTSHEAYFEMANIYARAHEFEMGEDRLKEILPLNSNYDNERMGDFYQKWGDYKIKSNIEDAIRKYKSAYSYYKEGNSSKLKNMKEKLSDIYISWAQSYYKNKDIKNTLAILNNADDFLNEPKVWYFLGKVNYGINKDVSFDYFQKAFNKNKEVGDSMAYESMLLNKANALKQQNNSNASYYYNKVLELNPKVNIPYIADKNVVVQLYSAKFSQSSTHPDQVIPGIGFKIMNASKDKIFCLKTKVVFKTNNEVLSTIQTDIATPDAPIDVDSSSELLTIYSESGVSSLFKDKNIFAEIYLSQNPRTGGWKLYRSATLSK